MSVRPRTLPVGWYPGSAKECQSELAAFVAGVKPLPAETKVYGGVMPHAGWYFSGKLAARVFYLAAQVKQPQVVCIFGGHLGGSSPPLLVQDEAWETPLGDLAMATNMFAPLQQKIACRPESPGDNTIEVQLPMVKYFFPQAKLLAVRAPHSQQAMQLGQAVAQTAQELNLSLLAFGSSDLTHYGPNYGWAPKGYGAAAVKWVKEVNDKNVRGSGPENGCRRRASGRRQGSKLLQRRGHGGGNQRGQDDGGCQGGNGRVLHQL